MNPFEKRTSRLLGYACSLAAAAALVASALFMPAQHAAAQGGWEPTKPIQFIIPAGTGGGADQMARFIQGVVAKHNLAKQPIIAVNKGGGAGAEGFLEVKNSASIRTRSLLRCPTCLRPHSRRVFPSIGRK